MGADCVTGSACTARDSINPDLGGASGVNCSIHEQSMTWWEGCALIRLVPKTTGSFQGGV